MVPSKSLLSKGTNFSCTSRSCITGFVQSQKRENFAGVKALCIGEQTAEEAGKYGFDVIVSDQATIESMMKKAAETACK